MKEKIKTFFAICILILAVPYIVTLLFQGDETSPDSGKVQNFSKEKISETLKMKEKDTDVEKYLVGVMAKEISPDYHKEALKAQAVIARTALSAAGEDENNPLPESMSREEMMKLWGRENFEKNYSILEEAAKDTKGEILVYQEKPAHGAFHAVSAGKTRSAKDALQTEEEPYLASVDSKMDIPSLDYLKVVFMEKEEFLEKLREICPELKAGKENILESVEIQSRDSADYAVKVKVGEKEITGEEFRNSLGLNSACFYIKEVENKVRIVTKGLGHGLGLSQYGANELAKEGKNYKEILQYYYKEIQIKR